MANDTSKAKGAIVPAGKATPLATSNGGTAKSLAGRPDANEAAALAAQLGFVPAAAPAPDEFESVRSNSALYKPEECIIGTDKDGKPIYCPIRGYPVGAVQREDEVNGEYVQVQIHLTAPCIALRGQAPNRERVLMQPGESVMVTVTSALDTLVGLALDPKQSVEVYMVPLAKVSHKGNHTFWDWSVLKSRKAIPRIQAEDPDVFPPAQPPAQ